MKKILAFVMAIGMSLSASAFAKTYTNNLGFGITFPQPIKYEVTSGAAKDSRTEALNGGFDFQYLGYFDFGLAFKANLELTVGNETFTNSVGKEVWNDNSGIESSFRLEAGYGFVRTDHVFVGLFAFFGSDYYLSECTVKSIKYKISYSGATFGIDPAIIFTPNDCFSLYASCGLGVSFDDKMKFTIKNEITDREESGKCDVKNRFVLYPAFGICWKF